MGRRRRSLIGTPKTSSAKSTADAGDAVGAESPSTEADSGTTGEGASPDQDAAPAEPSHDDPSASDVSEDTPIADPAEEADPPVEAETDEGASMPVTSWDEDTADADAEYTEADTVMEGDHVADAFAEEGVLEEEAEDEADPADEDGEGDAVADSDASIAEPDDPSAVDYSRYGMDTGVVEDAGPSPFDVTGAGSGPPTEEVALHQDVGGVRSAPMNVPAPPDVPGMGDRFTPPPAQRSARGQSGSEVRPSYLAEPTPAPAGRNSRDPFDSEMPVGAIRRKKLEDEAAKEDEELPTRYLVYAAVIGGIAVVVLGVGLWTSGGSNSDGTSADAAVSDIRGVEVRKGVEKEAPEFLGNVNEDVLDAPEDAEADADADAEAETEAEVAAPEPEPVAQPAPAPVAPRPKPRPKPVAATGQLMVRANRKVLVVVDGKAVGYTPIDHEVTAGAHTVDATVPGQPSTKQTQSVTLESGSDQTLTFTF